MPARLPRSVTHVSGLNRYNGFVDRINWTLLDECFRVHGRTTWYESVDEIQADLDRLLLYYNLVRSHRGRGHRRSSTCLLASVTPGNGSIWRPAALETARCWTGTKQTHNQHSHSYVSLSHTQHCR